MAGAQLMSPGDLESKRPTEFDYIMLRVDPPITFAYSCAIRLLAQDLGINQIDPKSCIINSPDVLLCRSGRLLTLVSPDAPESVVSSDIHSLYEFLEARKTGVIKLPHGSMGSGVHLVSKDLERVALVRLLWRLTAGGKVPVLAQRFLENYLESEKRVWYVDGEILGAGLKRLEGGEFPPRLAADRCLVETELTVDEHAVCERVGRILKEMGIRLAGVDLIGLHVTDINVTSPGLLMEMEQARGENLAASIIEALERGRKRD